MTATVMEIFQFHGNQLPQLPDMKLNLVQRLHGGSMSPYSKIIIGPSV